MLANLLKQLLRPGATSSSRHSSREREQPPESTGRWLSEALLLQRDGRYPDVEARCRSVLASNPDSVDALNLLAAALCAQGKSGEGIIHLRRVAELSPDSAEAWAILASVLAASGDADGAIENYRRAVGLRPDFCDAWNSLGRLLKIHGRYDEAEDCCRAGLEGDMRHAVLHHTLADTLFEQGRVDDAIAEIRIALNLKPDNPVAHSQLVRMLNYVDTEDPAAVYRAHRAWAGRFARPLEDAAPPHRNDPDPSRRLRVGFVSPYLQKHAVTFFLEPLIEHHDRENLEVILYADVMRPDEYSTRLQTHGAAWRRTVDLDDGQLAQLIRDDMVDILVDLSGHTNNNRLLTFARRPAPIQVNWLGFPSTTGMTSMDYRITDAYCDPPGTTEHLNSEKLVRLPRIYMAWRPLQGAPDVGPLPALQTGHVTFGSFNSCFKITPTVVSAWSRILARLPGSRLMLLAISSIAAKRRIMDMFCGNGIEPERLEMVPRLPFDEYLSVHQRADIGLGTFPFHGATTTCASLWMGVPMVTLAGQVHASRADVSMLNNIGLPQLVAQSSNEYVDIAIRLANDLTGLAALRAVLRDMMLRSPNTDGRSCARDLENAFREMWTTWCRKQGEKQA